MLDFPTPESYSHAAWFLRCNPLVLRAIGAVEAGSLGAFLATGEPTVLFERHIFHELTQGRYDSIHLPGAASENNWISLSNPGGYGPVGLQHSKLRLASSLDHDAALKSCSWGLFQILGRNHAQAGFPVLQDFINAMYRSVDDHLRALVFFIHNDSRLQGSLISEEHPDWKTFARVYNGPAYYLQQYDQRLAAAYTRLQVPQGLQSSGL